MTKALLLRYRDLKSRGYVNSHVQLKHLQDKGCFPSGAWLGPNTHVWTEQEIEQHLRALQLVEIGASAVEIAKATGYDVAKAQAYIDMVNKWRQTRRRPTHTEEDRTNVT
jgi:hypothetical protein